MALFQRYSCPSLANYIVQVSSYVKIEDQDVLNPDVRLGVVLPSATDFTDLSELHSEASGKSCLPCRHRQWRKDGVLSPKPTHSLSNAKRIRNPFQGFPSTNFQKHAHNFFSPERPYGMEISVDFQPIVPPEIIFTIIDELSSRGDFPTLINLSQTCRLFNLECCKCIFSKIAIGLWQDSLDSGIFAASISNLENIFARDPIIAKHVHRVVINVANPTLDGDRLFSLLRRMESLSSLRLTSEMLWSIHDFSDEWRDIKPTMARCIEHLLRISTLIDLEIFRLQSVPITVFCDIPNVKFLRLHASTITLRLPLESHLPCQRYPPLTRLDVRGKSINTFHRILLMDQVYINFFGLKEIFIVLEERMDMVFLEALLTKVGTLSVLSVTSMFLSVDMNIISLMQLPSLAHIKDLKLEYTREGKWNRPQHLLTVTCNTLSALQHKEEIEKVSIKIRCLTVSKHALIQGLESLDLLLADAQFRSLRRVRLCIEPAYEFSEGGDAEWSPTTKEFLLQHLGRLTGDPDKGFIFDFVFKNFGSS